MTTPPTQEEVRRTYLARLEADFRYAYEPISVRLTRAQITALLMVLNAPTVDPGTWRPVMREAQLQLACAFCGHDNEPTGMEPSP